jgi:hypothetical protein
MRRSTEIGGFTAACVLTLSITACGNAVDSGQGEDRHQPPLPSAGPSPEAGKGANVADGSECRKTFQLPTNSPESIATSAASVTASSCGTRSVPLTEEQMRNATPAPMPLRSRAFPEESSTDSQVTTRNEGEQREWTPERMRSASPEPMPRVP